MSCIKNALVQKRGFTLLEIVLALGLFSVAVVGFATCISATLDASMDRQRDQQVRLELEARLSEARENPIQPGTEKLQEDENGIQYEKKVEAVPIKNEQKQEVFGIYTLQIEASWLKGTQKRTKDVKIFIYQP